MADNIVLNSGSGGATLAADDISSVWYQIVKHAFGPLNTATLVTATVGLPVDIVDADQNAVLGTATYSEATTIGTVVGAVRNDTLATLASLDNEIAPFQVNAAGALYVEVSTQATGAVTNAGTFVVQEDGAALTALQLIDDAIFVDDTATHSTGTTKLMGVGAVAVPTDTAISANDIGMLAMSLDRRLLVDADITASVALDVSAATLTVNAHAVTNAGTFAVQVDGDALTALQLIDNPVAVLGTATYAETTTSGMVAGAVRNDALAALAGTDNEIAPLQVDEDGGLWTHPAAGPLGGCKMFTSVDLDESEEDPTSGPTTIYGIYAWNLTAAPLWLQMFNTNTVTVGTTAPTNNFMIPANADSDGSGVVIPIPVNGLAYATALTVAITTGSGTNNGAPGAGDAGIVILYQD